MSVMVIWKDLNMNEQQYNRIVADLDAQGFYPADGRTYHVAAHTDNGFTVVEVWDTEAKFHEFETTLTKTGARADMPIPEPEIFPVSGILH